MQKPLVSIIVPAYNAEKYLEACLDSILAQTYKNYEVIAINDGSVDSTHNIMKAYRDKFTQKLIIIDKENGGQGAGRNEGIELAKGKYIAFVDSDDLLNDTYLEKLILKAENDSADIVICNYALVRNHEIVKVVYPKIPKDSKDMLIEPDVVPWKQLWKRDVIVKSGVRFAEGVFYEDIAFYLSIAPYIKTISSVPEILYYYIDHGSSTVHGKQDGKVGHIFKIMNQVYNHYVVKNFYDQYKDELEYVYVKILLCSSIGRISQLEDNEMKSKFIEETFSNIEEKFANYRKNKYLKRGIKAFYMKHISKNNVKILMWVINRFAVYKLFSVHQ